MSEKVDLIIGGVQKAGTTALFAYLSQWPQLASPRGKEIHFFDNETVDWNRPDYAHYHAFFPPADGRIRFEATPIYLFWPNSLTRIHAYNASIKLVFLFRDPIERAYSQWKMEFARGDEKRPFDIAIREPLPDRPRLSYVERGLYGAQTQNLFSIFKREQCLLLRSDDLDRQPQNVLDRIADFVGVRRPPISAPQRIFEAARMEYPSVITKDDRAYLSSVYRDDLQQFAAISRLDISDWKTLTPV